MVAQKTALLEEISILSNSNKNQALSKDVLERQIADLSSEILGCRENELKMSHSFAHTKEELLSLKSIVKDLEQRLSSKSLEKTEYEKKFEQLFQELEQSKQKIIRLNDELDSSQRDFSEQFGELENLRAKIRLLEEESRGMIGDYVEKMNIMEEEL